MKFAISLLKIYLIYYPEILISGLLWIITHFKWFDRHMILCGIAVMDECLKYDPDNRTMLDFKAKYITMLETL